jgi:hypothetical protein
MDACMKQCINILFVFAIVCCFRENYLPTTRVIYTNVHNILLKSQLAKLFHIATYDFDRGLCRLPVRPHADFSQILVSLVFELIFKRVYATATVPASVVSRDVRFNCVSAIPMQSSIIGPHP